MYTVTFTGQGSIQMEQEQPLLVAAKLAEVPLKHRCDGHARCGTCLVTIEEGSENTTPAGATELRILKILKADENRRLACQCGAKGDVTCKEIVRE